MSQAKVCSSLFSLCGKFPAATGSSMLVYGLADKVASETAEHAERPHLTLPRTVRRLPFKISSLFYFFLDVSMQVISQ